MQGPVPSAPPLDYNEPPLPAKEHVQASAPPIIEFRQSTSLLSTFSSAIQIMTGLIVLIYVLVTTVLACYIIYGMMHQFCLSITTPFEEKTCIALPFASLMGHPIDESIIGEWQYLYHIFIEQLATKEGGMNICQAFL